MRLQGVGIGDVVELDEDWVALCRTVARLRFERNRKEGNVNQAQTEDPLRAEMIGAAGEVAFGMLAGVWPWLLRERHANTPDCTYMGVALDVKHLTGEGLWATLAQAENAISTVAYASVTTVKADTDDKGKWRRLKVRFDGFCPRVELLKHGQRYTVRTRQGEHERVGLLKTALLDTYQLCSWFESQGGYHGADEVQQGEEPSGPQPKAQAGQAARVPHRKAKEGGDEAAK